jgi:small subunit ribosomal protein S15
MHSHKRGKSGSTRPLLSAPPAWSLTDKKAIERLILELHEDGNSTAMIGTILRDKHAVPDVRMALGGKRVGQVLKEQGVERTFPEDMMNLMRKALCLIDHLGTNHKDIHNTRQLELCEAKIRRLARYYRGSGTLAEEWEYKRDKLRLIVE